MYNFFSLYKKKSVKIGLYQTVHVFLLMSYKFLKVKEPVVLMKRDRGQDRNFLYYKTNQ